ncbi:6-phosphogluconolactonase [Psychrosphaera saromensis]|uniref:6-phosphogluconolactonase n=1 Tax=Psychrosphaera saromensis TaxID=716813 RepID=A0A2S7UW20_9GAMM|nr:6-phosphogluconolactonase [Psychrosphaera saromensis]PQJ54143.1 6-phosphogluconolactonase [Psychrosphaera saromensis]GHB79975.1 6-phosphogluconolactonase [Psychrosphaera saromensis]GLQ12790.1 6-phosphogluconolactonase [Psychrosphaera saromensis]
MKAKIRKFENSTLLNEAFSQEIADKLQAGINENGSATLLVSGGNTPKPMFLMLSNKDIEWNKVNIALVDDRWVELSDSASNEAMVNSALLINKASVANFVGMKTEHKDAFDAQATVSAKFDAFKRPFDVVILGMGEDGHTASIFPCCAQLDEALTTSKDIMATEPTTAPHQRMTFTKSALLNSKQLYLHLVGESKETVLLDVAAGSDEKQAPIRAFLNQSVVPMSVMLATTK